MTPFLLRRVKTDVDLQIPPKKEVLVYCPLTQRQEEMYRAIVEKTIKDLIEKDDEKKVEVLSEKRKRVDVDYSVFLDEREFGNSDDKFEAHIAKLQEYKESLATVTNTRSAYQNDMETEQTWKQSRTPAREAGVGRGRMRTLHQHVRRRRQRPARRNQFRPVKRRRT